ncbi:MAG: hypothetical protein HC769_11965 [Cyanobacteria bacterium CRU_2_1]|nr:hypothetical protein [Cyanobacteria bacterium CRU_2_1]
MAYLKRRTLLAFPIACLVATLATFYWHQIRTTEAERWVSHTEQVCLEAQQLLSDY